MGYYTSYTLKIQGENPDFVWEFIDEHESELDYLHWAIEVGSGYTIEPCKWYDHDDDMKWLSEHFPDYLFILEGYGEENGDIWRKYYKGGKMQHCPADIVFEEFDESKLR